MSCSLPGAVDGVFDVCDSVFFHAGLPVFGGLFELFGRDRAILGHLRLELESIRIQRLIRHVSSRNDRRFFWVGSRRCGGGTPMPTACRTPWRESTGWTGRALSLWSWQHPGFGSALSGLVTGTW